ncbi:MAG: hypothetical protein K2G13_02355 [Muribaculaceae bacterium]|nr:hypothetical protein [Muribaculaceae bacterium]
MGYNGGKLSTPVNSDDVVAVTAYNNHDWGHFCSGLNSNINKWSLWKPYRCAGESSPTNLQVAQMHFGIDVSTARHTGLENAVKDPTHSQISPARVQESATSYQYLPPTGGAASPYRITDFADLPDETAPAGLQFARQYDANACAPDAWRDWTLTEAQLKSCADKRLDSIPGGTDWTIVKNGTGLTYSFCDVRFGIASGDVVGNRPSNAMPLSLLFGEDRIANEKWRIGLAVYLPYGISSVSASARWMVFAGVKPITSANGGDAFPFTGSNIELCEALWYNFKTKGVKSFTFIPCLLMNSTLTGSGDTTTGSLKYKTRVELVSSLNPQLLLPPTFTKCTLTIDPTPVPGHVEQYHDSSYRGYYATNLVAGTYKVMIGTVVSSGSGYTRNFKYYRVTIPSGTTIKIEYVATGYGSTGNLKITASGSNVTYYEYASQSAYNSDTVSGAAMSATPSSAASGFFSCFVGASAPSSVTVSLEVHKI